MNLSKGELYFTLFANCIPVKGAYRSLVCDVQWGRSRHIPNLLFDVLQRAKDKNIKELKASFDHQIDEGIDTYFKDLEEEEWGMFTDEPQNFTELSMEWEFPGEINNAIIDVNESSNHDYETILNQLNALGCEAIQFRFYHEIDVSNLSSILSYTTKSRFVYLELLIKYNEEVKHEELKKLLQENLRLRAIVVHSSSESNSYDYAEDRMGSIVYTTECITSNTHCGVVSDGYFRPNLRHFTEAQHYNTCLNKKISIDIDGSIKNCPSLSTSYGNIKEQKLSTIANREDFRSYWSINKDQIDVCKDCEFRYICTDCRAFVEGKNKLGKPFKCSYDPYKGEWNK